MAADSDWEGLYRETRHRIGNTMQMLLSLLRLQMRKEGPEAKAALARLEVRMSAAAAAYALARVSTDDGLSLVVDLAAYVRELIEEARRQIDTEAVPHVSHDLVTADIPLDQAIPAGVAITEVLAGAVQHGGPPIHVTLEALPDEGLWRLTVSDDHFGVPAEALQNSGLGLRIAESLMRQVKGQLVLENGQVRLEWQAR